MSLAGLVFFAEFLAPAGLVDRWVRESPLRWTSLNVGWPLPIFRASNVLVPATVMAHPESDRRLIAAMPEHDRRLAPDAGGLAGFWRRVKGALKRPLRLERRGLQWHIVLVERRRSATPFRPASELRLLAELGARLLTIDHDLTAAGMGELVRVHDLLRQHGWHGVETMSGRELARALAQCELLNSREPSRHMAALAERLRILRTGAALCEESAKCVTEGGSDDAKDNRLERELARLAVAPLQRGMVDEPEVGEASLAAYREHDRNWVDTVGLSRAGALHPSASTAEASG